MKFFLLLLITTFVSVSVSSFGQERISKRKLLNEYQNTINDYIPEGVSQYEVLLVNLSTNELLKKIKDAHYLSYFQHGIDTLSAPKAFLDSELESFKGKDISSIWSPKYIKWLQKRLKVKVVVSEQLSKLDVNTYRYLLDIFVTSNKASPEALGFVITFNSFFLDRLTGKKFKKIDDKRIFDLVD